MTGRYSSGTPYAAQGTQAPTDAGPTIRRTGQRRCGSSPRTRRRASNWTTGVFYQHAKENTIENVYDPRC